MSRTIWKVVLDANRGCPQIHTLPFGAKPLAVGPDPAQPQYDYAIAVWFEVDPQAEKCGYPLWVIGTGHEIPGMLQHVGSLVLGPYGCHVYMGRP